MFIKDDVNKWRYVGNFRVDRRIVDAAEIQLQSERSGRHDISQVLYLVEEQVTSADTTPDLRSAATSEVDVEFANVFRCAVLGGFVGFSLGLANRRATFGFVMGSALGTVIGSLRETLRRLDA